MTIFDLCVHYNTNNLHCQDFCIKIFKKFLKTIVTMLHIWYNIKNLGERGRMEQNFDKWDKRFIELAETVGSWSSCYQDNRHIGAVIVKNKRIMTTGYNGAPSGIENCRDKKSCMRRELNIASGTRHELCYAVHAEQNAIAQAAKMGVCIDGATLYCTHQPCIICTKIIINAGIKRVVYKYGYPDDFSLRLLKEAGIELQQMPEQSE